MQSPAQRLRDFCADYEIPKVILLKNEQFVSASVEGTRATIITARYEVANLNYTHRITGRKLVIRYFIDLGFTWRELARERMIFDDPEFTGPVEIPRFPGKSLAEHLESIRWADDCYRPGTGRTPMDNADRALASIGTPWQSPMVDYYLTPAGG